MNIKDAVQKVGERFEYEADSHFRLLGDTWQVMRLNENGKYVGDCDDFTITSFWHYSGENLFKFLLHLLITHRYAVYRAKTDTGYWHVVGSVDDLWFDNWSQEALPKEQFLEQTGHSIKMRYIGPLMAIYLFWGLFFDKGS